MKTYILVGALLVFTQLAKSSGRNAPSEVKASDCVRFIMDAKMRLDKHPVDDQPDEVFTSMDYALSKSDSITGVLGVVSLWSKGKDGLVELVWWRQQDATVRRAALLLFYSMKKEEASGFPGFESFAKRFEAGEAESRAKEIAEMKVVAQASRGDLMKSLGVPK
ncbi:hypothetical protein [Prosthecobacter dejongeii]|uniref:Uncharacterized protein n=1 Tax=Prosthecobacter dejongeii TaxID=48465 RepID=A0A7W8DS37_9BACT|nr:hypothetical protein [Prosthecobacter dejongeii]MBB5039950.1 hypothetical protein [Prosthecobacter dejongeii]